IALEHVHEIDRLNNKHPVIIQEMANAKNKIIQVIDMKEHSCGIDDPGRSVFVPDLCGKAARKEIVDGIDPGVRSELRDFGGGLDSEHTSSKRLEPFQESAIVTTDVNDEVAGINLKAVPQLIRYRTEVFR